MRFTVRCEGEADRLIVVDGPEAVIGKSDDCEVAIADGAVSRRHARVFAEAGKLHVEDLGSTNGTTLAGRPLTTRAEIRPGEAIEIGSFTILVEAGEKPPMWAPKAAPVSAPVGLDELAVFFADDDVTEVMINGPDEVFVERAGKLMLTDVRFASEAALRAAIEAVAAAGGRPIDARRPLVDLRLADGSRMNAILPPLALRGPCVTIRRFSRGGLSLDRLVELGAVSAPMLAFLRACVQGRVNLLLSGGTSSGKTTLLNGLCGSFGADERIVTIEDAAELRLPQRHVVPLETRPADAEGQGAVGMRDLVRNALRMRPDRIVIGEVRGPEALDMLTAMNTGHEGSLSTIHANTPREALGQLETLVQFAADLPLKMIRDQIVGAIRIVVQTNRVAGGKRRVSSVAEVTGLEGEQITMGEIYRFDPAAPGGGAFRATGYIPRVRERLSERGLPVDMAWFR